MKRSVLVVATLLCCVSILATSCRASNIAPHKITMGSFDSMMENAEQRDIDELHMVESDTSQDKQDEPDENDNQITLKDSQEKELKSDESTDDVTTTKYQTTDDGETFQKQNFANEEEVYDDDFPGEESVNDAGTFTIHNENNQEGRSGNEETWDESDDLILQDEKDGTNDNDDKGVCDLRTYTGSAFQGRTIRVHNGFVSAMNRINAYANTCGVKIYVTSSFRKVNVPVSGAIVPPASRSNHFVGHAIDMNLIDGGRWCNSGCLGRASTWTRGVSCFLKKIRADSALRWGGDFSRKDPVHIDDGINWRNSRSYNALYAKLQKNC